jgi:RNA polymerase sigma factor (sigma-70 family)
LLGYPRSGYPRRPESFIRIPDPTRARRRIVPKKTTDADNAALLARCVEGDEEAWGLLVGRYENLVFSVALGAGLNVDEAEDVFQQVWIELFRSARRIRSPQALPRWLMVATRRLCFKQAARSSRRLGLVSEDLVDPDALPDEVVEAYESRRRLEEALSRLDAACARLLRLLFLAEKKISYRRISKETGLAVGSIGPIRSRCLTRLRRILETT